MPALLWECRFSKRHHYSEPLPLNQWVTLTVIAERGKTTVFVDGRKTGEANDQMVAPLRWLGSHTGHSFVGKIRNLRLRDRLLTAVKIAAAKSEPK